MSVAVLIGIAVGTLAICGVVWCLVPGGKFIAPTVIVVTYVALTWTQRETLGGKDIAFNIGTAIVALGCGWLFYQMKKGPRGGDEE